jgi:tetratricopeptide (TPR) repeat protein
MVLVLAVAAPAVALADETEVETAKRHYQSGRFYYERGDYEQALDEFTKSHKLAPRAGTLYNIGLCEERLGKLEAAIKSLERYLREQPRAADASAVRAKVEKLKQRLASSARATREPEPAPPPPPRSRPRRTLGWTALGIGAAALVTSGILGGLALSKTRAYEDAYREHKPYAEAQGLLDSANALEKGTFVSLGVGVALAAAGVTLLVLDRERPAAARVGLLPAPRGLGGGIALEF